MRDKTVSMSKGIAIILMVLAHTDFCDYGEKFIYMFHMPLFFFLAGMSIKPKALKSFREWRIFIRKNALALVVPYLIFAFIYAPFSFDNVPKFLYGFWQALGKTGTLTSLWYLTSFFTARIYCQILMNLAGRIHTEKAADILGILAVPMFAVGFLLPKLEGGYPWCLDVSFVAAGFILMGIALRKRILMLAQTKGWGLCVLTAAAAAVLICGTIGTQPDVRQRLWQYLLVPAEFCVRQPSGARNIHAGVPDFQGRRKAFQHLRHHLYRTAYDGHLSPA